MTAVKTLVAVMTLLLVAGLGLLGYGMAQRSSRMGLSQGDDAIPAVAVAPDSFDTLALEEPAGSTIAAARADGQGRLLLSVTGGGIPDRVVIIDLTDGRRLGLVTLGDRDEHDRSAEEPR